MSDLRRPISSSHGFSLVELSIVLVILGLLTGGILSGQSLIHAAELRAIGTEYDAYRTATNTFRQKYFGIPGDFNKAEDFWGTAPDCGSYSGSLSSDGSTCSGNGDGLVVGDHELVTYWQHLANANLINGTYLANHSDPSVTLPQSKFGNAWWVAGYVTCEAGESAIGCFVGKNNNGYILMGLGLPSVISPSDAWNIDTKLDDGSPAKGNVQANYSTGTASGPNCTVRPDTSAAGRTDTDALYKLDEDGDTCWLYFFSIQ